MDDIIAELEKKYKPSTVRTYANTLRLIFNRLDYKMTKDPIAKDFPIHKFLEQNKKMKASTQRNYISALIALLKGRGETDDKFYNALSEQRDFLNGIYLTNAKAGKNEQEEYNWIPAEQIKAVYEAQIEKFLNFFGLFSAKFKKSNLSDDQKEEIREKVILAVYYIPFQVLETGDGVFRNSIVTLKYFKGKTLPSDKNNYFYIENPKKAFIVLRDHKTSNSKGTSTVLLNPKLARLLSNYCTLFGLKNGDDLFPGMNKHHLTNLLMKFSRKHFNGKALGSSMLRKILLSTKFGDSKKEIEELKKKQEELADKMQHSASIASEIYTKTD